MTDVHWSFIDYFTLKSWDIVISTPRTSSRYTVMSSEINLCYENKLITMIAIIFQMKMNSL